MSKLIRGLVTLGLGAMLTISSGCATGKSEKINYVTKTNNGYQTIGCASGNFPKHILVENANVAARANLVQEICSKGGSETYAEGFANNCNVVKSDYDSSKHEDCETLECYNPE